MGVPTHHRLSPFPDFTAVHVVQSSQCALQTSNGIMGLPVRPLDIGTRPTLPNMEIE